MEAGMMVKDRQGRMGRLLRLWDEALWQVAWADGSKGVIFADRLEVVGERVISG